MSVPVVFPNKTEHALALLKTQHWALGLDQYGCFYGMLCDPFRVVWFQQVNRFILRLYRNVETACIFSDNSMLLSCCPVWRQSSWNASRLKAVTFCLSFFVPFVLGPRAASQCPSAQDAGFGGSADHAVGELPGVLHARYAVHHGRVTHRAGLLCSGWHELSWYLIWWGSRQVSGLSVLRV